MQTKGNADVCQNESEEGKYYRAVVMGLELDQTLKSTQKASVIQAVLSCSENEKEESCKGQRSVIEATERMGKRKRFLDLDRLGSST